MQAQNLKPFQKGVSGNPRGRPKGSLNMSTRIRNYLESKQKLSYKGQDWQGEPADLIIRVYTEKAIEGDIKAATWLAKFGYGTKVDAELDEAFHTFIVTRGETPDYSQLSDDELTAEIKKRSVEIKKLTGIDLSE